jgi:hypothetical protein
MRRFRRLALLVTVTAIAATATLAQRYYERRYDRGGVPSWSLDKEFAHEAFTFVRIRYSSGYRGRGYGRGYGRGGGDWATDYPDSDLNFSYRLHQLTSLEVNPEPLVLELTDPELVDYPFIYLLEPGRLVFSTAEVEALRSYLLNGGFLMVDDFWGEAEWDNFYQEIQRVFPDSELLARPPALHAVFDTKPDLVSTGPRGGGQGAGRTRGYKALYDDKGRMMAIICHNTDLGDGWEREGEDEWYFHEFTEKKAYPLGINIVVYAMTH